MAEERLRGSALSGASCLGSLCAAASAEPAEFRSSERPFEVLKTQNLVLFITVLSILLLAILIMAVCVYKPLRRR